jgi:nitrite reductase/ring-hydroxylating ferredoxin subunit
MAETIRIPNVTLPAEGKVLRVMANGTPVAVFHIGAEYYAIDARCTHVGGPLDRGMVQDGHVTCPLHGSMFDVKTGKVLRGPAARDVSAYRVHVEDTTLVLER